MRPDEDQDLGQSHKNSGKFANISGRNKEIQYSWSATSRIWTVVVHMASSDACRNLALLLPSLEALSDTLYKNGGKVV